MNDLTFTKSEVFALGPLRLSVRMVYQKGLLARGMMSLFSFAYINRENPICRRLFKQVLLWPCALARVNAGNNSAARIAMIAMTTSNSINVNARRRPRGKTRASSITELMVRPEALSRWKAAFVEHRFGLMFADASHNVARENPQPQDHRPCPRAVRRNRSQTNKSGKPKKSFCMDNPAVRGRTFH